MFYQHTKVDSCCCWVCVQLEAIPESLKNMLLVMDTAGIFHSADSRTGFSDLWEITWERIVCFLPHLKEELFKQTVIAGRLQAQRLKVMPSTHRRCFACCGIQSQCPVLQQNPCSQRSSQVYLHPLQHLHHPPRSQRVALQLAQ